MNMPKIKSYETKTAKTGESVPVVNNVHLHSIYNPVREAKSFAEKNEETLRLKNEVLIFGLGFGYHIHEISNILRKYHNEDFKIVIIDPNQKTTDDYNNIPGNESLNHIIYSGKKIEELYQSRELVSFLIRKPGVIAHPASFNLYNSYFKNFLAYRASSNTHDICKNIDNNEIRDYIQNFEASESIDTLIDNQISNPIKDNRDFLLHAFRELTRESVNLQENA